MEAVDNNQFEVKPTNKRKILACCPNVYLNPALDILANEDPICNTAMEVIPNKKKKHIENCDSIAFENSALDLGISKPPVNELLARELNNVCKNVKHNIAPEIKIKNTPFIIPDNKVLISRKFDINEAKRNLEEPIYANVIYTTKGQKKFKEQNFRRTESLDAIGAPNINSHVSELNSDLVISKQKSNPQEIDTSSITNIEADLSKQLLINNTSNLSLSFIDRLVPDSSNTSNQSLYFDDDLNESNIMEIKSITIIRKKNNTQNKNTNPFLDSNSQFNEVVSNNPFLNESNEIEYSEQAVMRPVDISATSVDKIVPRKLFTYDMNSTISTVNESSVYIEDQNEYENVDSYRSESPIYENIVEPDEIVYNKPSKVLGCNVSQLNTMDMLSSNKVNNHFNSSSDSSNNKKQLKNHFLKVSYKMSKKFFKTLKQTFKSENFDNNISMNPYEVPRKPKKHKKASKESGIENPALNLDNSDDIEIEEIHEDENEYETVITSRNTQLNINVTPLKEKSNENEDYSMNRTDTPGKKVRFDATLNQEKIITGNSFESDMHSPGFNSRIEKYHDELENCINERKFLQQNM